jgi:electron transport complex protein RnfG
MAGTKKSSLRVIMLVAATAIVASAIVSGSYEISFERIQKNQQERELATLDELLKASNYDEVIESSNSAKNTNIARSLEPFPIYLAIQNGSPTAVVFSVGSSQGYNGPIYMLVGIDIHGNITGVRITNHRETPGLGDQIEIEKSDWITNFNQKNIFNSPLSSWKVTKDGGQFDGFTSATITARAVIYSVRDTLAYFEKNKTDLITQPVFSTLKTEISDLEPNQ